MTLKNASTLPKRFYGLHFLPGIAEYQDPNSDPYRIFINEATIRSMNKSFEGRPVYVEHVDEVDVTNIQTEADGYVVRSFYNAADGKTWVEFLVVSDRGHQAIQKGWKLSNAYIPKSFAEGGLWNGVTYAKEVTSGEFEHLAIVPNPRYEESVILTPEDFKLYNEAKELELKKLSNSFGQKKGESSMFKLFKKTKVENSADIENMSVTLPKSGKEVTLTQLINDADDIEKKKEEPQMANDDHMVDMGEGKEKMSVKDMKNAYMDMKKSMEEKKNEDAPKEPSDEEKKKKENDDKAAAEENKKNAEASAAKLEEEKKTKNAHFEAVRNAPSAILNEEPSIQLTEDKVARGKARYGS